MIHAGVLGVAFALFGCAFNTQQRTEREAAIKPRDHGEQSTAFRDEFETHKTAYIEFDEQGDFWDRRQFADAVELVRGAKRKVILVIYAHGWENHSQSKDVRRFNEMLLERVGTSKLVKDRGYDVLGVYIAWNGKRTHVASDSSLWKYPQGVAQPFTFWGRKNAASNRVAGTSASEAILTLARAAREGDSASKVVMIGHSFGGLVMERAVAQAMMGALLFQNREGEGDRRVVLPADLILLLNSAAEAIYAKQFIDFFRSNPQENSKREDRIGPDRPFIVSMTSEADSATGFWWKLGTGVSNLFGAFREYETESGETFGQRRFLTRTPGHQPMLLSHKIKPKPDLHRQVENAFEENLTNPQLRTRTFATQARLEEPPAPTEWWQIVSLGNEYNDTPYWVVRVPGAISSGHSDVWNESVVDTMAAMFRIAQPTMKAKPSSMEIQATPMVSMPQRVEPAR